MWAQNSRDAPEETRLLIKANEQTTEYQTELNGEHTVTDTVYTDHTSSHPSSAPSLVLLHELLKQKNVKQVGIKQGLPVYVYPPTTVKQSKSKVVSVHTVKAYKGIRGVAPFIYNLGSRCD
jgi:hypothetical protein